MNFDKSSYEVREDSDEVMIMIVMNQPSSKPFDVMINLMDVTAESKCYCELLTLYFKLINAGWNDYRRSSIIVSIPANQMSTSFTINIIDNNIAECDETFTLTLSVPSSPCGVISGSDDNSEVMIRDDDGRKKC